LTLPVDITGNFDTGVAFFNPGSGSVTLNLKLLDANGFLVSSKTQTLASKGHLATFVDNLFPGMSNYRGSLAVSAGSGVAATTLRQYGAGLTYTTLPTVSGTATGSTQLSALLAKTVPGINAIAGDPDIAWSERLSQGSALSGTVSGAGQGLTVFASAGGNNIYTGDVNPLTGRYLIVVPDGTYTLTACYQPSAVPNTSSLRVTYEDPTPVLTSSGGLRDMILPSVSLFPVSGTVSGTGSLASAGNAIVFTSSDNRVQGRLALDANGKYLGSLPAGNYSASFGAQVQNESLQIYNLGSLSVSSGPVTGNYTIPAMAKLSGVVNGGGFQRVLNATTATALDASAPAIPQISCCAPPASSSANADSSNRYQLVLAQNRNYAPSVMIPVTIGSTSIGTISYPVTPVPLSFGVDATFDFNVPAIRGSIQIYGNVNDGLGHNLSDVTVTAVSQSVTGATNVGVLISTKTDINGNYIILVPAGSYQLRFIPTAPKP
jgi:hypothetical protein